MENTKYSVSQKATLIVVLSTSFLMAYTFSSLNLAIPAMSEDFGARASLVNWIMSAYVLVVGAFSIPFGRMADFFGRKRIMDIGLVVYSSATLLIAFSINAEMAIVLRAFQGIGGAMVMATNMAILVSAFPKNRRGAILGINMGVVYTGQSIGPILGGFLTHSFGWQSVFYPMAVVGYIALIISITKLSGEDEQREELKKGAFDGRGMTLFVLGFIFIMYGLSEFVSNPRLGALVAAGIILAVIFVWHEKRTPGPILDLSLLKNSQFVLSNLATVFSFGSTFVVGYFLSIYLQLLRGYDAQSAGFIMLAQPIIVAVLSLIAGRLSDKYPPFIIASIGMGCCTVSLFIFAQLTLFSATWVVVVGLIVIGFGFGFFSPSNTNAIMSSIPAEKMNAASAMLPTTRHIGNVMSMTIISFITNYKIGATSFGAAPKVQLMETIHISFVIFCVLCAAGVVISLQRRKNYKDIS